jgi:hypothetical protein
MTIFQRIFSVEGSNLTLLAISARGSVPNFSLLSVDFCSVAAGLGASATGLGASAEGLGAYAAGFWASATGFFSSSLPQPVKIPVVRKTPAISSDDAKKSDLLFIFLPL